MAAGVSMDARVFAPKRFFVICFVARGTFEKITWRARCLFFLCTLLRIIIIIVIIKPRHSNVDTIY